MKGDFSRITFDKKKHYSKVLNQQGRVCLDADWNEQQAINQHRIETEAIDVIGGCGAPMHSAGFEIKAVEETLMIGKGRYYVDGILCENDSDSDIAYGEQPDRPPEANVLSELGSSNFGLVYLDVWQRHITKLDDPLIHEVALGNADTTTRVKTIWQVKILPLENISPDTVNCNSEFPEWCELINSSSGKLNARTKPADLAKPCFLPPSAGYQSLENQLYRIEIHEGGPRGTAKFKWSRDNGSIITNIETINGSKITVHDVGPDNVLGFAKDQWAEILEDTDELNEKPGEIVHIDEVDQTTNIITLTSAPTSTVSTNKPKPKLRRWDSKGAIEVPDDHSWVPIENGIEVQFCGDNYKTGDYWTIPARTATGEIEWPRTEPPDKKPIPQCPAGILHHYCRLALVQKHQDGVLRVVYDCRKIFPPLTELTSFSFVPDCEAYTVTLNVDGTSYKYNGNGWSNEQYPVIDLFGEKYVTLLAKNDPVWKSQIKLSELILDTDTKYTLKTGEKLPLGHGYSLEAKQVDVDGEKVWLEFTKDGEFVDDEIISVVSGSDNTWEVELDDIQDEGGVVVLRVRINQVFQGAVDSIAQIEGLWLIDYPNAKTLKIGEQVREFTLKKINSGRDEFNLGSLIFEHISNNANVTTVQEALNLLLCRGSGGGGCCIVVNNEKQLQEALDKLEDGSTICLLASDFKMGNISIRGHNNIVIRGCKLASRLISNINIVDCENVIIENLDISGNIFVRGGKNFSLKNNKIMQTKDQKLQLTACSGAIIESNQFKLERGFEDEEKGLEFNSSNDLKIQKNTIIINLPSPDQNGTFFSIVVKASSNMEITDNLIQTLVKDVDIIEATIGPDTMAVGIRLGEPQTEVDGYVYVANNRVNAVNAPSLEILSKKSIRVHGNFFRSVFKELGKSSTVKISSFENIIITDNFFNSENIHLTNIDSNIDLIYSSGSNTIFSNNLCELKANASIRTGSLNHVGIHGNFANVIGNRCEENIRAQLILSIDATGETILIGNITSNQIEPLWQGLNIVFI